MPLRDGLHIVFEKIARPACDCVDGAHGGIDRTIAVGFGFLGRSLAHEGNFGVRFLARDDGDFERLQLPALVLRHHRIINQGRQIVVVDEFLFVPDFLESDEDRADFRIAQFEPEMLEARGHGVASAVFGQGQLGAAPTHLDRIHDLVGLAHLEHAVLVDARTVGEGVLADDGLAALHVQSAHAADNARGFQNFPRVHVGVQLSEKVGARFQCHDHFFQRGIAGAFADAVDRAFHLSRPGLHGGQRVGHGQAEVVVAMHADDGVVDVADVVLQISDQRGVFLGHGEADRVGNVDRGRARSDDRFDNLREKFRLGARSVLRRELDILAMRLGQSCAVGGEAQDFLMRFFQFVLAMDFRGGEENVDASAFPGRFDRGRGRFDVLGHTTGQSGNDRSFHIRGDALHRLEVALADHGKPRLNDIDIEPLELAGDLHFLT